MRKKKGTRLQRKKQRAKEASLPWKLYRSINTLLLKNFLDAYCDGNLHALIIEGEPTEKALKECWEEILEQYYEAIGGTELSARMSDVKELIVMDSDINLAWTLIYVIEAGNASDELLEALYNLDYRLPKLTDDNILRVLAVLKSKLKRKQIEYDLLVEKVKPKGKVKKENTLQRTDFYKQFVAFAEMFGGAILRETQDYTSQYCAFVSVYNKRIEAMQKQNAKWQGNK